jgi:hypothetical protein
MTENPDRTLARRAWQIGTPAALVIAVVFSTRVACGCNPGGGPVDFKFYGEHCGPGHGTDADPVDELDEACREHDRGVDQWSR